MSFTWWIHWEFFPPSLINVRHTKTLLSIIFAPPGSLISIRKNDHGSKIYKPKLHNPIENIVKIATDLNCQGVAYLNGHIYGFCNSLVNQN